MQLHVMYGFVSCMLLLQLRGHGFWRVRTQRRWGFGEDGLRGHQDHENWWCIELFLRRTCTQWPNFTASDEFGGADFVCRAKRQLITVMQQLGNYRLSFSRFGLIIQWQSQWLANKVISTRWIKPLQCLVNPFPYHQPKS